MTLHAFVDESRRCDRYLLAAALVDPGSLARVRKLLRGLLLPGQRELHFKKETPARWKTIISALVAARVEVNIYTQDCRAGDEAARQECVRRLTDDLLDLRAVRVVLDSRDDRDRHDKLTIRRALGKRPRDTCLVYEHVSSTQEQILWVSDAVAWCFGAGGDWLRRVQPVVGGVIDLRTGPQDSAKPGRRPSGR